MSYASTQYLDPDYDDIECSTIEVSGTATITNLVVTGNVSLPTDIDTNTETVDTMTVVNSFISQGTSNLNTLTVTGDSNLNTETVNSLTVVNSSNLNTLNLTGNLVASAQSKFGSGSGSMAVLNPYLYHSFNSYGVFPTEDNAVNPSLYGCTAGNLTNAQAEVDLCNIATSFTNPTQPAFNFYKLPSTTPIVTIQNNGQIQAVSPSTNDNSNLLATTSWVQNLINSDNTTEDVTLDTNQTITGQKTFTQTVLCTGTMPLSNDSSTTLATTNWTQGCVASWMLGYQLFPPVLLCNGNPPGGMFLPIYCDIPDMSQAYYQGSVTTSGGATLVGLNFSSCDDFWIIGPYYQVWSYGSTNYQNQLWNAKNDSPYPIAIRPPGANSCISVQIDYTGPIPV
jgi:hypothetical protein